MERKRKKKFKSKRCFFIFLKKKENNWGMSGKEKM